MSLRFMNWKKISNFEFISYKIAFIILIKHCIKLQKILKINLANCVKTKLLDARSVEQKVEKESGSYY